MMKWRLLESILVCLRGPGAQQSRGERGEKEMCEGPEAAAGNRRGTPATKSG